MWKKTVIVALFVIFLSSAFLLHQAVGQQVASVSVQLSRASGLDVNDTLLANITVSNVIDLYGWQVSLYYKSSVLGGINVDEGPFLKAEGATYFIVSNFTDNYNATHGYLLVSGVCLRDPPGVNGSGTLATVTFKVVGAGSCVLHFGPSGERAQFDTELENSNQALLPYTAVDGEVTTIPEFPSFTILPLFMIVTLVSLIVFRKWKMTGAKPKL